mgnify:CR=1 FL=1
MLWKKTKEGKWFPLDPEPAENGNIVLVGEGECRVLSGNLWEFLEEGLLEQPRYRSHFVTCSEAKRFRRK